VDVYLCAGTTGGVASTIVDLTGAQPAVLRQGAVSTADIEAAFR
jgi:tRNA A37 threonylcarbamoyladenosine synthetase subunit TsaC/SUA5/YrdC